MIDDLVLDAALAEGRATLIAPTSGAPTGHGGWTRGWPRPVAPPPARYCPKAITWWMPEGLLVYCIVVRDSGENVIVAAFSVHLV